MGQYISFLYHWNQGKINCWGLPLFRNKTKLTIQYEDPPPKHNHHVFVLCKVIDVVMSSTQESEKGSGYIIAIKTLPTHQTKI